MATTPWSSSWPEPTAVSVGTANFANPYAAKETAEGILAYMKKYQVADINELIGAVH